MLYPSEDRTTCQRREPQQISGRQSTHIQEPQSRAHLGGYSRYERSLPPPARYVEAADFAFASIRQAIQPDFLVASQVCDVLAIRTSRPDHAWRPQRRAAFRTGAD